MRKYLSLLIITIFIISSMGCIGANDDGCTILASASAPVVSAGEDVLIEGTVFDGKGNFAAGADVAITVEDHVIMVSSGTDGYFHFEFNVPEDAAYQLLEIDVAIDSYHETLEVAILPKTTPVPSASYIAHKDIAYIERPDCDVSLTSLDVYVPLQASSAPILIFVHGGAWVAGDKGDQEQRAIWCASNGFILVSVNYRLSPAYTHPSHIEDVAASISWVIDNAAQYGGDTDSIFLMGHSAGAHLVALAGTDEARLSAYGVDLSSISGVITLDGASYDIPLRIVNEPSLYGLFSSVFGGTLEQLRDASPYHHVEAGSGIPPFLLLCAEGRQVSFDQSSRFSEKLVDEGGIAQVEIAVGKNHGTIESDFGKEGDLPTSLALDFINDFISDGE